MITDFLIYFTENTYNTSDKGEKMKNIGEYILNLPLNLKVLRTSNHFTQKYVASKLGITYQSYQAYENGKSLPSLESFIALAELFDVSLDSLIGRDE